MNIQSGGFERNDEQDVTLSEVWILLGAAQWLSKTAEMGLGEFLLLEKKTGTETWMKV
jgi:hypothetical protein